MKVSIQTINYINDYYGSSKQISDIDAIVQRIGAQLGAVEEVVHYGPRYDGIVIAKVVSCDKHPDADKLSVCVIDDGGRTKGVDRDQNDNIQVVCGATNVREGLIAAWIPPGATVPSTIEKDPFVLEAREIRGVVSNGMLASPAELGISDNHDGILEIDPNEVGEELIKPGTPFKQLYGLDDVIIDCENKMFTHRPDCFGILGVARELAGIQGLKFDSPEWYLNNKQLPRVNEQLPLLVKVEDEKLVPRFMASVISNVTVVPSPVWLQAFLTRVGIKPINNIVDITNYYSQLTGQPTHAYDYDKVANLSGSTPTIIARRAKKGDKVTLLNGKTVEFDEPTVIIATDKQAIGVGGVMGGSETEVDKNTKNIIIECANFDMYNIRRTSMKYGLFTDAVTRFTKGQSVHQNDRILTKITSDIIEQCGGAQSSEVFDIHPELPKQKNINVSTEFINERLGSELNAAEMQKILDNVEISVNINDGILTIIPPFWRTDIEIPEDVVEEVGRLHGFNKLPILLPKRDSSPSAINITMQTKQTIREILTEAGVNEVLTYTFVHGNLMDRVGQDKENAFKLSNALSPDLQYYRQSLLPSLLDKVHLNVKSGHNEFALFEINKVHTKDFIGEDGLPAEDHRLAFVFVADKKVASSKYQGAAFYQAKKYLEHLLTKLGIDAVFEPATTHEPKSKIGQAALAPFERSRAAYVKTVDGELIAELGEINARVRRNLKLPDFVAGFELDVLQLQKHAKGTKYVPLSRFPSTDQDITLQVNADKTYQTVFDIVLEQLKVAEQEHGYQAKLAPVDVYQPDGSESKNITLRITLTHSDRTLVTDEVNKLMEEIAKTAKQKLDATQL